MRLRTRLPQGLRVGSILVLLWLLCGAGGDSLARAADGAKEDAHETLVADAVTLDIRISRTAHLFHVVDQIAQWSPFCHRQYLAYFTRPGEGLSAEDHALLQKHAAIRARHDWGSGLEQTFYTGAELPAALKAGVAAGYLTPAEAATESDILTHFAPRVDRLLTEEMPILRRFQARLQEERPHLADFSREVSRFFEGAHVTLPVYLIANPDDNNCGGGYNGGRLTLEIPHRYDVYPIFLHETFHAFIETQAALKGVPGLDYETLNEGMAYALAPGIYHPDASRDPLLAQAAQDYAAHKPLSDAYTRFNRYGLALRPLLAPSLRPADQTFATFLPRALDAWRVLQETDQAVFVSPYRLSGRPSLFVFGLEAAGDDRISDVVYHSFGGDTFTRENNRSGYDEMFTKHTKAGDVVLIVTSLDTSARVPAEYADLLPAPWPSIEARLNKGESVVLAGTARQMQVHLIAAPHAAQVAALIQANQRSLRPDKTKE